MRFLTAITVDADGGVVGEACVPAGSPAAEGDLVRDAYLIEIAAQAAAAHAALVNVSTVGDGTARPIAGVLVGARDWIWHRPVAIGRTLAIRLRPGAALGALRHYDAHLSCAGEACASGAIQVALTGS